MASLLGLARRLLLWLQINDQVFFGFSLYRLFSLENALERIVLLSASLAQECLRVSHVAVFREGLLIAARLLDRWELFQVLVDDSIRWRVYLLKLGRFTTHFVRCLLLLVGWASARVFQPLGARIVSDHLKCFDKELSFLIEVPDRLEQQLLSLLADCFFSRLNF